MAIYKKINKQTGAEELRYIVWDGDVSTLEKQIHSFRGWDFYPLQCRGVEVNIYQGIRACLVIESRTGGVYYATGLMAGDILIPIMHESGRDLNYNFIGYSPEELEARYPSDKYDTEEVEK